jgi:uncharacterized protein YukE
MSVTSLTHAEAVAKMNQVDEAMNHARQLVQSMQDRTAQMTSSSWLGNQASLFGQRMQGHTDDFTAILNRLENIVATGKSNMTAALNLDAE